MDLAGRAAEDGEVLAGEVDEAAIDGGGAGHDAIGRDLPAGQAEVDLTVLGEQADLLEAAGIDEGVDALAGGELALFLLLGQPVGAAPLLESLFRLAKVGDQLLHRLALLDGHCLTFHWRRVGGVFGTHQMDRWVPKTPPTLQGLYKGSTVTLWDLSPSLTW